MYEEFFVNLIKCVFVIKFSKMYSHETELQFFRYCPHADAGDYAIPLKFCGKLSYETKLAALKILIY